MAAPPNAQKEPKEAQQRQYLDEMNEIVKRHAFYMNISIDAKKMSDAFNYALSMLNELRTNILPPNLYYELHQHVCQELSNFEDFIVQMHEKGESVEKLYQKVQYCGNILPRLYLLITVGSACIRVGQAHANTILCDLVEMVKGIQHPMRGLFLRSYLLQVSKDKLPESEADYESFGGNINDAIEFLLVNFREMNSLWVRMQHHSIIRNRKIRSKVRGQLRMLVCKGLERISSLEGLTINIYQTTILPRVLSIIEDCKEPLAQQTLMEVLIQVFPDEFHMATLTEYLPQVSKLVEEVNTNNILIALMERIGGYAERNPTLLPKTLDVFTIFMENIQAVVDSKKSSLTPCDILELCEVWMEFIVKYYKNNVEYCDTILGFSMTEVQARIEGSKLDSESVKKLVRVLVVPLDVLILDSLKLKNFAGLLSFLPFKYRKKVASKLLKSVLNHASRVETRRVLDPLLVFISPLVSDEKDAPTPEGTKEEEEQFEKEQTMVASLVTLIQNDNPQIQYETLSAAAEVLTSGGYKRCKFTMVPMLFNGLQIISKLNKFQVQTGEKQTTLARQIFVFLFEKCVGIASSYPVMALQLFQQIAIAADRLEEASFSSKCIVQAFLLYENHVVNSNEQFISLLSFIGTLISCKNMKEDKKVSYSDRTFVFTTKLLQAKDQCHLHSLCSFLYWNPAITGKAENRPVLRPLQAALRIIDESVPPSIDLLIELFDYYLYFFEHNCEAIQFKFLIGIFQLINDNLPEMPDNEKKAALTVHYTNTVSHIRYRYQNNLTPDYVQFTQLDLQKQ